MTRDRWRLGPPLLGLFTGWVALIAWSGMVTKPGGYLLSALFGGLAMALVGAALRRTELSWYVVASLQLGVGLLALNLVVASEQSFLHVVPTRASVREVVHALVNGGASLNAYAAPVAANPHDTQAMLMACGLAVLWSVDVLALGLRRSALAALPLLITLSIPVSILQDALALPVFVGTALLFLRLLATEHLDRYGSWGDGGTDAAKPALTVWWQVSLVAVVFALLVAPLIPVADLLDRQPGDGNGVSGSGVQLTAVNPLVRLRRDLVDQTHTPLLYAETKASSTSYVRTTVLDEFRSDEWLPSPRNLPGSNSADGDFPGAPGLAPGTGGSTDSWSFQLAPFFATTWLPLPYPILDLDVSGSWRYDSRTLDVALVGNAAPKELRYRATSFSPTITASTLEGAVTAPQKVVGPMTEVPKDLPEVITTRAREVTRGATSEYAKAVALQDWFRDGGGFRYSLERRSGSGMGLLADFVTNDRVGYCEQFAAAMAAMGRALDIPSRVVVGFLSGTPLQDGRILYTSDDRHAWPEMYFTGIGWVRFEPTPGQRSGASPSYTRQTGDAPVPTTAPTQAATPRAAPEQDSSAAQKNAQDDTGLNPPWWAVVSLLVLVLVGSAPVLVRVVQRRQRLSATDPVHLAEGAWAELRATALDLGLDWPDRGSPREQARRVVDQVPAGPSEVRSLEGLLVQVERGRYARPGSAVADHEREQTVETVETWRRSMVDSIDRERGWRRRWWPVSLFRGRRS